MWRPNGHRTSIVNHRTVTGKIVSDFTWRTQRACCLSPGTIICKGAAFAGSGWPSRRSAMMITRSFAGGSNSGSAKTAS